MFGKRTKKSLGQCKGTTDQGHPLATPHCHNSSQTQWKSKQRVDENLLQLLFPCHSHPPLLFQVSRGLTLNEDSQDRLLACHTATYHTSSSHEQLYCPPALALLPFAAFSMSLLALSALLLTSQRKRRKSREVTSSHMPHTLQVAVKGPHRHLLRRRVNVTTCRSNGADGQKRTSEARCHGSKTVNANPKNRPDQGSEKRNRLKTTKFGFKCQKTIKREKSSRTPMKSTQNTEKRRNQLKTLIFEGNQPKTLKTGKNRPKKLKSEGTSKTAQLGRGRPRAGQGQAEAGRAEANRGKPRKNAIFGVCTFLGLAWRTGPCLRAHAPVRLFMMREDRGHYSCKSSIEEVDILLVFLSCLTKLMTAYLTSQ